METLKMDSTQKVSSDTFGLLVAEQYRRMGEDIRRGKAGKRDSLKSLIGEAVKKAFGGKSKKR